MYIIHLGIMLAGLVLSLAVFFAFRAFVAQGGVLLGSEPGGVMRNGVLTYFTIVALVIILSLTIVLLPIALIFILAGLVLIVFGQASMAMLIGLAVGKHFNKRFTPVGCFLIGLGILTVILSVPYLHLLIGYVFMPILSMGLSITTGINWLVKKKFYYAPFKRNEKQNIFDKEKIRSIIKKDLNSLKG